MTNRHSLLIATLLAVLILGPISAAAAPATPAAVRSQTRLVKASRLKSGLASVMKNQDKSGGFLDSRGTVDPGVTSEVLSLLIALRNIGVKVETAKAVAYLQKSAPSETALVSGGDAKVVVALVGAGADPRDVGGVDLVARVVATWDKKTDLYGTKPIENAYALMALAVTGEKIKPKAIEALAAAQIEDGSWAFGGGTAPGSGDAVMTSFVIQTLLATGAADPKMIEKAVAFLKTTQTDDGAFGIAPGAPPDSNTTGFVISALTAAGEDLSSATWSKAVSGLVSFQNPSGGFRYDDAEPQDDILSTIPALIALSGAYLPVLATK